jgi:predicted transcriptional regulator
LPDKRKKAKTDYSELAYTIFGVLLSVHHSRYVALRKHLKGLRRQAGLTQIEIAGRLRQEQSYVSKIERGERYVDMLFYLDWCRACEVEPDQAIKALTQAGA